MTDFIETIRSNFPALSKDKVFFDGPGGTQVAQQVIDRMQDYFIEMNANSGGAFSTSQDSDHMVDQTRASLVEFLNATRSEEIIFGANMSTLTFSMSRSIAHELKPGDEIILTRLDHDANISPWQYIAEQQGCVVKWLDFDPEDCTLRIEQLDSLLTDKTKLVAVGFASNSVGTINPIQQIVAKAHEVGALTYIDSVHYAPHGPIDVQSLDCDFLVTSAYKFFGPHVGILYGKYEHLERLQAYKVRPASSMPPDKFETGTGNFEGIAGVLGTLEYLSTVSDLLGKHGGETLQDEKIPSIRRSMQAILEYERSLTVNLLHALKGVPGLRIWGNTDVERVDERVPTVSFTMDDYSPREIAERLAIADIHVWDGNYYAPAVTERLGVESTGGMVRVGLVHYNTLQEVERLSKALQELV